ncbi:hypothetical protein GCM10027589_09800 [Actinocorallia lasiicapitis]
MQLRNVALIGLVLLLLGLSGCASDKGEASGGDQQVKSDAPDYEPVNPGAAKGGIALPLDAYILTPQQQADYDIAVQLVARDCMKEFGLTWAPVATRTAIPDQGRNSRLFGVQDADSAARFGYRGGPAGQDPTPPGLSGYRKPTPVEHNVYYGEGQLSEYNGKAIPPKGCGGGAHGKLVKAELIDVIMYPPTLRDEALDRTNADPRVKQALEKWKSCMKGRGYSYSSPAKAVDDPAFSHKVDATHPISRREIQTAAADVECKLKANYTGTAFAAQKSYELQVLEKNSERLDQVKTSIQQMIRNTGLVLEGKPPQL